MEKNEEMWLEFVLIGNEAPDALGLISKLVDEGYMAVGPKLQKMIDEDSPGDGWLEMVIRDPAEIPLMIDELKRHGVGAKPETCEHEGDISTLEVYDDDPEGVGLSIKCAKCDAVGGGGFAKWNWDTREELVS